MTSVDKDGFTVSGIGPQAQSARKSSPKYSISTVGREARHCVYISESHIKTDRLGRTHPKGAIYDLPSTLGERSARLMPTDKACPKGYAHEMFVQRPDGGPVNSTDELCREVDSQGCKFRRQATILIGTEPRGKLKDAFLVKNHSAAFFGRESPGPAALGDKGAAFEKTKPRIARPSPFTGKAKVDWLLQSGTPECVGPGQYPVRDVALGPQYLSQRRNQAKNGFPQAERFQEKKSQIDIISKYEAATSSFGTQGLSKNRSAPSIGFGSGTRDGRSRSALCMHKLDQGPKATMPKAQMYQPPLTSEKTIMSGGCG